MNDCSDDACGCRQPARLNRRTFLTLSTVGLAAGASLGAEPVKRSDAPPADHFVPADKNLRPEWVKTLVDRGERKVYRGAELRTIGMPCGGIAAGQLYVRGDGRLAYWWMMNNAHHSSSGGQTRIRTEWGEYGVCYDTYGPPTPLKQGFRLRVGDASVDLSEEGFDDVGFIGEYPVATVLYERKKLPALPVTVQAQVFSPFIPLNAKDSALPATLLRFTVRNVSQSAQPVALTGYLQNPVFQPLKETVRAQSRNRVVRGGGLTAVEMDAFEAVAPPKRPKPVLERFDDFENGYGKWTLTGDCWGDQPARGTLPGQQNVSGFNGERLVNTFLKGDAATGKAVSQRFTLKLPYVTFLIGGGSDEERLGLRLVVDGKVVRRAAARRDGERLESAFWDVREFAGKSAHFEIVDNATGPWGHTNVDQIAFTNTPPEPADVFSRQHPLFGDVVLAALSPDATASAVHGENQEALLATTPLKYPLTGSVRQGATLQPGEEKTFTFALCWYFPNRRQREDEANGAGARVGVDGPRVGQKYATWFSSARDVAAYVARNEKRLVADTLLFRDTLYDTTLPYWLVQRCSMPLANMATEVYQWWENGRVWCWEGVGCCTGNCGHVFNYAQAPARLFPELERSVRTMQDFAPGRGLSESGAIGFRG
ncbi:MAG TPA: GH116 family glycosyl-hydrolase, partial [Armatimonadaceae bacterium]|nr:GH116 family glycosyl-hydrolase [Armatimonadaceae bacterium]